mgnify:CR=1 FL=1
MQYLYPFIISFIFIFLSELGDKTQILVLSFSAKNRTSRILLGVALGTLLSHGIAIMFGSRLGIIGNETFLSYLKLLTYFTFIVFGVLGFIKLLKKDSVQNAKLEKSSKATVLKFISHLFKNCVFIVACSIAIGELGDKTFLASIGLGVQYPIYRISLIGGSICGMVASNSIAIFFGKILSTKVSSRMIEILSNIIFILFGIIGLVLR